MGVVTLSLNLHFILLKQCSEWMCDPFWINMQHSCKIRFVLFILDIPNLTMINHNFPKSLDIGKWVKKNPHRNHIIICAVRVCSVGWGWGGGNYGHHVWEGIFAQVSDTHLGLLYRAYISTEDESRAHRECICAKCAVYVDHHTNTKCMNTVLHSGKQKTKININKQIIKFKRWFTLKKLSETHLRMLITSFTPCTATSVSLSNVISTMRSCCRYITHSCRLLQRNQALSCYSIILIFTNLMYILLDLHL